MLHTKANMLNNILKRTYWLLIQRLERQSPCQTRMLITMLSFWVMTWHSYYLAKTVKLCSELKKPSTQTQQSITYYYWTEVGECKQSLFLRVCNDNNFTLVDRLLDVLRSKCQLECCFFVSVQWISNRTKHLVISSSAGVQLRLPNTLISSFLLYKQTR